jgi:hypothetical protein
MEFDGSFPAGALAAKRANEHKIAVAESANSVRKEIRFIGRFLLLGEMARTSVFEPQVLRILENPAHTCLAVPKMRVKQRLERA